jgi:hypothetical protein
VDRLTWSAIQSVYSADPAEHFSRAQALGLNCPLDVFKDLFHDHHGREDFADIHLRFVDWNTVVWEEVALSGVALRQAGVARAYQYAVDEARIHTAEVGFTDDRPEVMQHWQEYRTWIRPPILIAGELLQSVIRYELLVGFTRLGNLLGVLDRQDLSESARHQVWIGRAG